MPKKKTKNKQHDHNQVLSNLSNMSFEGEDAEKKTKKPFVERVGDWVCIKCKNLNFSFRVICNRCQLPKAESDNLFDSYMNTLMNHVNSNDPNETKQNVNAFNQNKFTFANANQINPGNARQNNYGRNYTQEQPQQAFNVNNSFQQGIGGNNSFHL